MTEAPSRFFVREIIVMENGVVSKMQVGNPLLSDATKCWLECVLADIHDAAVSAARKEGVREAAQIADRHYANGDMGNPGHHIMAAAETSP